MSKSFFRTLTASFLAALLPMAAMGASRNHSLQSPDGKVAVTICAGETVEYSVTYNGRSILEPSRIAMNLEDGTVFGTGKVRKVLSGSVSQKDIPARVYKKGSVDDVYNFATLVFKDCRIEFRAYDDCVAYRFVDGRRKGSYIVKSEDAEFNFAEDFDGWVPFAGGENATFEQQFTTSFEAYYTHLPLSEWSPKRLSILPMVLDARDGVKVLITEANLRHYPGMYLNSVGGKSLKGVCSTVPTGVVESGPNLLHCKVTGRTDYIAEAIEGQQFPWRVIGIAAQTEDLLSQDIVWKLSDAEDPQQDWSWIKPGLASWEWWNAWNISGVDFRSGINDETYRHYIDFAAENGIPYVIMDAGWTVRLNCDMMDVIPELDLKGIVDYAASKGVGMILWGSYMQIRKDIEGICRHYSQMGVKGFKIDYMNRDDQDVVDFYEELASVAAKYHLVLDFHGAFKPAGLQRTYPNVLNFEGVQGLEQMKWGKGDEVTYDVQIPFIRMAAGPMDYTQGAMRNATRNNYSPVNSEAMSQGTRCRQLAEYAIFDAPLGMMCDSPSAYKAEPECTEFIASFPTTWDETVPVCGEIGEYVAIARRKGGKWYVGAMTDWNARDLEFDLSFIGGGKMTVFQDGVNADKIAKDYRKVLMELPADGKVKVHMAPGGGWAAVIE
ncbi:MAG: glycoside hydrolase family 97 protein [Bacteroidales bacterium]|nr:glycoside hydrolase family 97 protein [Candidatus Cryptobacteroides faecihippi]